MLCHCNEGQEGGVLLSDLLRHGIELLLVVTVCVWEALVLTAEVAYDSLFLLFQEA